MFHIQDKRRTKFVDQKPDKTNQPTREGVARKGPPFFYDHRTWSNAMAYQLDEKDKSILKILQENGDFTTRDIAKKTLLPITTVHNRIQKLKGEGIIRKFTIDVDPEAVDKAFMAYVLVSVNIEHLKQLKKTQYDIAKELRLLPFSERVDIVAGGMDIIMVIRVKDVKEFNKVLLGKIQLVEGVKNTQSMIVIHGS